MNMLCYFITLSQKATMSNKAFLAAKVMFFSCNRTRIRRIIRILLSGVFAKKNRAFFLCYAKLFVLLHRNIDINP